VNLLEVVEFLHALAWVRDHHLRVLLENRRDRQRRDVLLDRVKALQRVRAHEKSIFLASSGRRLFTCGPPGTIVTSRPYFA